MSNHHQNCETVAHGVDPLHYRMKFILFFVINAMGGQKIFCFKTQYRKSVFLVMYVLIVPSFFYSIRFSHSPWHWRPTESYMLGATMETVNSVLATIPTSNFQPGSTAWTEHLWKKLCVGWPTFLRLPTLENCTGNIPINVIMLHRFLFLLPISILKR